MAEALSKTYKEIAQQWLTPEKLEEIDFSDAESIVEGFAAYLDSFAVLDDKMQILAYQKAREIDREVLLAFAALLPKEKVESIIKEIYGRHYRNKTGK